jgi:hypothetical protein
MGSSLFGLREAFESGADVIIYAPLNQADAGGDFSALVHGLI